MDSTLHSSRGFLTSSVGSVGNEGACTPEGDARPVDIKATCWSGVGFKGTNTRSMNTQRVDHMQVGEPNMETMC